MSVKKEKIRLISPVFGALLMASTFAPGDASAQANIVYEMDTATYGGEFVVPLNKSKVLRVTSPFAELRIGNSGIADVLPLTDRNVYILGKAPGSTSLSIFRRDKTLISIVDLMVSYDVEGLKRRLFDLIPDETIEVRGANDAIVLSGVVSSAGVASTAATIAERYAPGKVTNLLQVAGSQQVMLAVRFAEMNRSVVKALGVETNLVNVGNDATFSVFSGGILADAFGTIGLTDLTWGEASLEVFLDALEQKGIVKTLAEPNLIALSGESASFLAGGEFPIPVSQDTTTVDDDTGALVGAITVEFKEFGVGLSFTPTVIGGDLINLVVAPEVSAIDPTTVPAGIGAFTIPGLVTRRAETTVELRDGQSFAIAGLLQNDFSDTVRAFPFLGDLPVVGALFRSTKYQRGETELVIVVTPHLVKPAAGPDKLALPTDNFVPPHEFNLFLNGQLEAFSSGQPRVNPENGAAVMSSTGEAGGLDGNFGHIIQ